MTGSFLMVKQFFNAQMFGVFLFGDLYTQHTQLRPK
jgi:hypothetical protein